MAMKSIILITVLVVVLVATQAQAQLLPNILPTVSLNVSGIVNCSLNGTTPAPPFPNATVQLQCAGIVIASNTTNGSGGFNITVNPVLFPVLNNIASCRVVVTTPLSTCNATLPSTGLLQFLLNLTRVTVNGVLITIEMALLGLAA